MAAPERWCRVIVVGPDGAVAGTWVLEGDGSPDVATVDDVARLALLGARLGGATVLTEVSPRMRELVELAGLPVEVEGQAEGGEEALGVEEREEEAHPGDPAP